LGETTLETKLSKFLALAEEAFQRVVALLSILAPEFGGVLFKAFLAVDEEDPELQFVFRRHVVFDLERWNIVRGHAYDLVGLLFGRNRARRQAGGPAPAHGPLGEGLQAEFGGTREELIADDPVGIEDVVVLKVVIEMVFDDAAHLDIGNAEGLRADFWFPWFFSMVLS